MNIENNYDTKIVNSVNTGAPITSTTKSEQSQNTVFENKEIKKKNQLSEKEVKYLLENGYDISKMSDIEVQQALEPMYSGLNAEKNPLISKSDKDINSQKITENNPNLRIAEINYKDETLRQIGFDPENAGVMACDFYTQLSEEEQQNFFIKSLAKHQYGEGWDKLPQEEQMQLMGAVEAQLAEKIPSWGEMEPTDRIKLGLAFLAGSDESSSLRSYGSGETEADLDVQIEETIQNIIKERNNSTEVLKENFNKEIESRYGEDVENLAGKQLEHLEQKVQKYGVESLNPYERELYDTASIQRETSGNEELSHIQLNNDETTSYFYKMKNSDEFKTYVEKRKLEIYNSMGGTMEEAELAAQIEYAEQDFKNQFADCKTENDRIQRYNQLLNSCTSLEERKNLNSLKEYVIKGITSIEDAGYEAQKRVESGNVEGQKSFGDEVANAVNSGYISEEEAGNIPVVIKKRFDQEAVVPATQSVIAVSPNAAKKVVEIQQTEGYTKEQQQAILEAPLDDPNFNSESRKIIGKNIGAFDTELQLSTQEKYNNYAIKTGNSELANAVAEGVSKYDKANQIPAFQNSMKTSTHFDNEDAIAIQKTLSDQIAKSHKDNQLAMHEEIMQSKFSEVQEYAAANIKDYDHSVQSKAIDVVYETGNSKAVQAVVESLEKMPPEVQKTEVTRLVGEIALNNAVTSGQLEAKIMGGNLTAQEIRELSPSQRREYFAKQFDEAPPAKKLEILMKLASVSSGIHQRTIYTVIARFSPSLLKGMVDRGMGKTMLESGLPIDAVNKIITVMKTSTNNEVIQQLKELRADSSFEKYFINKEQFDEDENKKNSTTIPNDLKGAFAARIDSPTYEKLKKHRSTMYIKS